MPPKLRNFDKSMEKYTDVVLVVKQERFYVSRAILSEHCTYFQSLFCGDSNYQEHIISDVEPQDFQKFLEVVHGEPAIFEATVQKILPLAQKFGSKTVLQKCERFLITISTVRLSTKWNLAKQYGLDELQAHCKLEFKTAQIVRKNPQPEPKSLAYSDKFIFDHSFEKVDGLAEGDMRRSQPITHLDFTWTIYITRKNQHLRVSLCCGKAHLTSDWTVRADFKMTLTAKGSPDLVSDTKGFFHLDSEKNFYWELGQEVEWDEIRDKCLADGKLEVETRVRIVKIRELPVEEFKPPRIVTVNGVKSYEGVLPPTKVLFGDFPFPKALAKEKPDYSDYIRVTPLTQQAKTSAPAETPDLQTPPRQQASAKPQASPAKSAGAPQLPQKVPLFPSGGAPSSPSAPEAPSEPPPPKIYPTLGANAPPAPPVQGKKFILKNVFGNVEAMKCHTAMACQKAVAYDFEWNLIISQKNNRLHVSLCCSKSNVTSEFRILADFELIIAGKNGGRPLKSKTNGCFNIEKTKNSSQELGQDVEWSTIVYDYMVDGRLTVEAHVNITRVTCLDAPKFKKLRNFDATGNSWDVMLIVAGQRFFVLKEFQILISNSARFKNIISKINFTAAPSTEIKLPDSSADHFQNFLEACYGDPSINDDTVHGILKIAQSYEAAGIVKRCEEYVIKYSKKTLEQKEKLAKHHNLKTLKAHCDYWKSRRKCC